MLKRIAGVVFCSLLAGNLLAVSTNTLPWYDTFESYTNGTILNGTNYMGTAGETMASALTDAASYEGNKVCYIPAENIWSNSLNSGSAALVWADMFVKIATRSEAPAVDSTLSAQFYFDENTNAVVQDGPTANWVTLSNNVANAAAQPVTGVWARITVVHNYTDKKWALIVNDELLDDNIGFINTSITKMNGMIVSNETSLDSIVIDTNYPNGTIGGLTSNILLAGDADADGMADAREIDYWEYVNVETGGGDADGDGRSNAGEIFRYKDPTDSDSFYLDLAFRDGFESASSGDDASGAWRGMTNSGSVFVQTSDYIEGSKALVLSNGAVNAYVDDSTATNVWVQIYSKPQPYAADPESAPISASQVASFLVATNGDLWAYDGAHWTNVDVVSSVATGEWMGFAVHLDYVADKYDLYVGTNGTYGEHMRRAHSTNLSFNTAASAVSQLGRIVVTNKSEDVAYVDVIAASLAYTNTGVYANTNLAAYDRLAGQFNDASMPPYIYSATDDNLDGKVGTDLARELESNDKLHIYSNGWNVYFLNGTWQEESGASIAALDINESMGMKIQRGAGVDAVAFYPYSNIVTMTSDVWIIGTNIYGWNQLASPFSDTRTPNGSPNYGFDNANVGDRIYVDGTEIYWNGAKWKESAIDSTKTLTPGQSFWYYHKGTGMFWTVSGE